MKFNTFIKNAALKKVILDKIKQIMIKDGVDFYEASSRLGKHGANKAQSLKRKQQNLDAFKKWNEENNKVRMPYNDD